MSELYLFVKAGREERVDTGERDYGTLIGSTNAALDRYCRHVLCLSNTQFTRKGTIHSCKLSRRMAERAIADGAKLIEFSHYSRLLLSKTIGEQPEQSKLFKVE